MTLTIPDNIAPLLVPAVRSFALDLESSSKITLRHLDEPFAIVAQPEVERARLTVLLLQAETLLTFAKLLKAKLDSK